MFLFQELFKMVETCYIHTAKKLNQREIRGFHAREMNFFSEAAVLSSINVRKIIADDASAALHM